MAVTPEQNAIAEEVVRKSKSEAQVDTGRLRRSINKKVQRGQIVFREFYYGAFKDSKGVQNSTLEENAKRMMRDIPYKIERIDEDGNIVGNETVYSSGRRISADTSSLTPRAKEKQKEQKKADLKFLDLLIERRREREKKDNTDEDN